MFSDFEKTQGFGAASRILWDNSLLGLAVVGSGGKFLSVNPAFCQLLEYTEAELVGNTLESIAHPIDSKKYREMSHKVSQGDASHYIMYLRFLAKTGGSMWVRLRIDAVPNPEDDSFMFFVAQTSDDVAVIQEPVDSSDAELGGSKKVRKTSGDLDLFDVTMTFVKKNLRWVIPLTLSGIGAAYSLYYSFNQVVSLATNTSQRVEALEGTIESINEQMKASAAALTKLAEKESE